MIIFACLIWLIEIVFRNQVVWDLIIPRILQQITIEDHVGVFCYDSIEHVENHTDVSIDEIEIEENRFKYFAEHQMTNGGHFRI
jgi:hypothetical protein